MSAPRYIVGIDLGTTHCVLAESLIDRPAVRLFDTPQLSAPGEVVARPLLPSFLYLPAEGELPEQELALPWGPARHLVGELARRLGARVPNRLVASAKSWVCHGGVNRRAPILPWSAPDSEPHLSPFAAQVAFLGHLRAAWEAAHPGLSLAEQEVVVTVPASFDEDARELTADAAREAGLATVKLLEEPQAAFYDFLGAHQEQLAAALGDARLVLVVDVGGGTTDLTLLRVLPPEEGTARPRLERIAVGGHLLLGGDNMDAALAHHVLERAGIERRLDPTEWSALVQSARQAKERLLAAGAPEEAVVSVQSRGSRLIGGTRSITLRRDDVRRVLLDGFLPLSGPEEVAARAGRVGLTTLGLPYVTDPAIPRHVCAFLRRHAEAARAAGARVDGGMPRPDLLLLNGGVFNAPAMVERLAEVLAGWYGGTPVALLEHTSLDTAVACGAARYGLARRGLSEIIGGGTARAFYLGVEATAGQRRAFCVAPRGMEEGATAEVRDRTFELVLDRRVAFPLYSYTGDRTDAAGALADVDVELEPLPPLEAVLRGGEELRRSEGGGVPVTLSATLDQGGTLQVYLVTVQLPPRRWRLQLALAPRPTEEAASGERPAAALDAASTAPAAGEGRSAREALPPRFSEARRVLERAFRDNGADDDQALKGLRHDLEELLGPRGEWSASTCRALWDVLWSRRAGHAASAQHEINWLRFAGWCLRPGFGAPGDAERMRMTWSLHQDGPRHRSKAVWTEWWILWRRVAPGLDRAQQQTLFEEVRPYVAPEGRPPPGPRAHGQVEMLRLLPALERLPREAKQAAGEWFLARGDKIDSWWPLGRLGAREPFHGEARDVVSRQIAEAWLRRLLELDWSRTEGAPFAAALLARLTGDPGRDIDAKLREVVATRLREAKAPASWAEMLTEGAALSAGDTIRVLGDSLPAGLRLI